MLCVCGVYVWADCVVGACISVNSVVHYICVYVVCHFVLISDFRLGAVIGLWLVGFSVNCLGFDLLLVGLLLAAILDLLWVGSGFG